MTWAESTKNGIVTTTLIDSYSESNFDVATGDSRFYTSGGWKMLGQSFFNRTTIPLASCKFYVKKVGAPPGNVLAYLYAHSGTFGSTGKPTGSAIAESDPVVISTGVTTGYQMIEFAFSGNNQVLLNEDTPYFVVLFYYQGDASNKIVSGGDGASPTHDGNVAGTTDGVSWTAYSGYDRCFSVYGIDWDAQTMSTVSYSGNTKNTTLYNNNTKAATTFTGTTKQNPMWGYTNKN